MLLVKLKNFGISSNLLNWFKSDLTKLLSHFLQHQVFNPWSTVSIIFLSWFKYFLHVADMLQKCFNEKLDNTINSNNSEPFGRFLYTFYIFCVCQLGNTTTIQHILLLRIATHEYTCIGALHFLRYILEIIFVGIDD